MQETPRTEPESIILGGRQSGSMALVAVLVIAAVMLAFVYRPWAERETSSASASTPGMVDTEVVPEPGKTAPDFVLKRADGSLLRLLELQGRPVFLNFWADWCTFCKQEMPDMQRVADEYGDDLVVLGINAGDPVEVGEQFVRRAGVSYERVYDLELDVTDGYRVRAMPTSYFIDRDGTIIDFNFGFMTYETMLEKVGTVARVP